MGEQGITGNPAVFAPAGVFAQWSAEEPTAPGDFVGFAKGTPMLVFHDPELTLVFVHENSVVFFQQIAADASPKRFVKKLPATGWKAIKGSYTSDGGEHVLFDAMYSADDYKDPEQRDDIEAESGKPMRVKLPKGEYRLEVLGLWEPDDSTELVAARLVPSSAPKVEAAPAKPAAKKPAAKKPEMKLEFVDGRFPSPLPPLDDSSPAFLKYLHEQEAAMLDAKQPMAVWEKEWKAIEKGKRRFTPAEADAVASTMLPIDFGKQPDNPDRDRVKGKSQWNQQNREFQALSDRRFVRDRLWWLILEFISRDPKLKRAWMKHVKETDVFYRTGLFDFLKA